MFILFCLSAVYVLYGKIGWVAAVFDGLKPAVVAIVAVALIKIGKKSLLSSFHYVVAIGAFIAIFFLKIPFPLIILAAIVLAAIAGRFFPKLFAQEKGVGKSSELEDESGYYLSRHSGMVKGQWPLKKVLILLVIFIVLWVAPYMVLSVGADGDFWKPFILFFTKAAFVTFGGAYAVLPYVAQVSVEKFNWLSALEMLDGLALGETTPGPLIMVLAFVGFMASWNQLGQSLILAGLGLTLTVYYTFLPCFLFIFAGAPLIERTRDNPRVKKALSIITAAVVGVVLNLSIFLLLQVIFKGGYQLSLLKWPETCWILISLLALQVFKRGMMEWLLVSAIFGLAVYFIRH
jgi:chromate transporter